MLDYLHAHFHESTNRKNPRDWIDFFTTVGQAEMRHIRFGQERDFLSLEDFFARGLRATEDAPEPWQRFTHNQTYQLEDGPTLLSGTDGQITFARTQVRIPNGSVTYPTFFAGLAVTTLGAGHFSFSLGLYGQNVTPSQVRQLPFTRSPLLVTGELRMVDAAFHLQLTGSPEIPTLRDIMTPPPDTLGKRRLHQFYGQGSSSEVVSAWLSHFASDMEVPPATSPFALFKKPDNPLLRLK